jgi:hypothetical protein
LGSNGLFLEMGSIIVGVDVIVIFGERLGVVSVVSGLV